MPSNIAPTDMRTTALNNILFGLVDLERARMLSTPDAINTSAPTMKNMWIGDKAFPLKEQRPPPWRTIPTLRLYQRRCRLSKAQQLP